MKKEISIASLSGEICLSEKESETIIKIAEVAWSEGQFEKDAGPVLCKVVKWYPHLKDKYSHLPWKEFEKGV